MDITSQPDVNEMGNAIDIALREVTNRYDFRDSNTSVKLDETGIDIESADDYKVRACIDILREKMAKRSIDFGFFDIGKIEVTPSGRAKTRLTIKAGIGRDLASKINKTIKQEKLKVQVEIRGDEVRISGKKRDDLQGVIALIKAQISDQPLSFGNFRD